MHKVQKTYTAEFKREVVRLARTSGKPIARLFTSGARNWPPMGTKPFREAGLRQRRREEVRRLKRELEVVRQERDILKRAMPWRASPRMNRDIMGVEDANERTELFA